MDRFTATVYIAGDRGFTSEKTSASYSGLIDDDGEQRSHEVRMPGITAAEIMVLRQVHGADAVANIVTVDPEAVVRIVDVFNDGTEKARFVPHTEVAVKPADELSRLRQFYGAKVIADMWPGATPRLPETFHDTGIDNVSVARFVAPEGRKSKKRPAAPTAGAPAKELSTAPAKELSTADMEQAA